MFTTLITCTELQALQQSAAPLLIVDCTADLMNPAAGLRQFLDAHIPGATHADLDHDLSAHGVADAASGGRHPLPRREVFAHWLRQIGLRTDTQVVVYDRNGLNFCGRLWWMLKWAGHEAVAVLDGGLTAWMASGGAVENGPATPAPPPTGPCNRPCASWSPPPTFSPIWISLIRPSSTRGPRHATAARSSPWTRWPVTFPVP